jgi:copper chaperone CopZ
MPDDAPVQLKIEVEGMHCGACVSRVRKALEKVAGLLIDDVEIGSAQIRLVSASAADALEAIQSAGYRGRVPEEA